MEQARTALIHAHRTTTLAAQVDAWHEAQRIHAYCDALEEYLENGRSGNAETVRQWINWCRTHAAGLDPLPRLPGMPDDPRTTPEDLRPSLRGWSPYEPKRR
ncbi:hypothetical protein ACWGH4_00665 [Streptomyces sp. NPDC054847]